MQNVSEGCTDKSQKDTLKFSGKRYFHFIYAGSWVAWTNGVCPCCCNPVIRSKDTKPEIILRKFLFGSGFRYKLHDKMLPGMAMRAVNIL